MCREEHVFVLVCVCVYFCACNMTVPVKIIFVNEYK